MFVLSWMLCHFIAEDSMFWRYWSSGTYRFERQTPEMLAQQANEPVENFLGMPPQLVLWLNQGADCEQSTCNAVMSEDIKALGCQASGNTLPEGMRCFGPPAFIPPPNPDGDGNVMVVLRPKPFGFCPPAPK